MRKYLLLFSIYITGCVSTVTVQDYEPVKSGKKALVRGYEMDYIKQLVSPFPDDQAILVTGLNDQEFKNNHVQVLALAGENSLRLRCSFQIQGGYIESQVNTVTYEFKAGYVYDLVANYSEIRQCEPQLKEVGLYTELSSSNKVLKSDS